MSQDDMLIYHNVDIHLLQWPIKDNADDNEMLGSDAYGDCEDECETMGWINRSYVDLRGSDWDDVKLALEFENELLAETDTRNTEINLDDVIDDDTYEDSVMILAGLDIGVASASLALAAAHCIPIASCNGSVGHAEAYPVIIFRCRPAWIPPLITIATETGCGLENADNGAVALFADDVRKMIHFAQVLMLQRFIFNMLPTS